MASKEELSRRVSLHLDQIGFSEERIRERIHTVNKCSRAKAISTKRITGRNDIEKIVVGSKREGIGFDYLNDTDVLQIDHGVICQRSNLTEHGRTIFKMEHCNAPPGHCLLRIDRKHAHSESYKRIEYALVKKETEEYLSSDIFMTRNDDIYNSGNGFISRNTRYLPRQGPSIPKYVEGDLFENYVLSMTNLSRKNIDFVRAFPCEAEGMLQGWSKRKRLISWPSPKTFNYVIKQPAYVVPVGQKGSFNEDLEWRICFNLAENHLVQSFNIIQTKVLVLLKLIAKHILQPVSKCITSFVMKNVALWLAEQIPQEEYCEEHLIDRLKDSLVYLRGCVEKGELPCYMIPERNLFAGKLQSGDHNLIQERLDQFLQSRLTAVDCYFNFHGSNVMHKEIDKITNAHFVANVLDKSLTCRIAMFSTEELTEYFVTMFLYESKWQIMLYNILFHMPSFLNAYGKEGLFVPLSVELSGHFKQEHKAENMAREQTNTTQEIPNKSSILQPPVYLLLLTLFIDVVFLLHIPGLCLIWSCKNCYWSVLFNIVNVVSQINEYRKTQRRKKYVKRNEKNKVITHVPRKLRILENAVSFLLLVNFYYGDMDYSLLFCKLCLDFIMLSRCFLAIKHFRPLQFRWCRVLYFAIPSLMNSQLQMIYSTNY